jgi:Mce-associated membrane protein
MAARWTHGMTAALRALAPGAGPLPGRFHRLRSAVVSSARHGWALPGGLAVAVALLLAASGYFAVQTYQQDQEEQRRQDIVAAARQTALNFTSLDYRRYDRDSRNVLKNATGDFKRQFASQTQELTKLVAANKSVSQGRVIEAGIARADERSARVLIVADSKVTNTAAKKGQARNYRLQLDLVRERGRWLTSDVEFVG